MRKLKALTRKLVAVLFENFGPIRVLFYVKNEIGFANQAPLIELMASNPLFKVAVVTPGPDNVEFTDHGFHTLFIRHVLPKKKARLMPWHYVISTDIRHLWLIWDSVGIHLAHGSCFGGGLRSNAEHKPWPQREAEQNSVAIVICSGLGTYEGLIEYAPELASNWEKAFLLAGSPKLSNFIARKYDRTSILKKLGLDPRRKTVLVSSHWTSMALMRDLDIAPIQLLLERPENFNIIVTGHPKLWGLTPEKNGFDGKGLLSRLTLFADNHPDRIRISLTGKPFELMSASDVLLCDHSSICVEYSLLGRPVGLYRNPDFICESNNTDELYRRSAEVFQDTTSLDQALTKILSPQYDNSASIRDLHNFFLMDPQRGPERIVGFLQACGRVSSPKSGRWAKVKRLEGQYLDRDSRQQPKRCFREQSN